MHPDIHHVDQDGSVRGRENFARRIDDLADMMSPTMTFTSSCPAQCETDMVLFRWALAEPGQPPVLRGAEVAVFRDGQVVHLYSVID